MATCCASGIRFEDTALAGFLRNYGYVDLAELHAVAAEEPTRFWAEVEDALGLRWATRYRAVLDMSNGPAAPRWFVGGKLDLYEHLVGRIAREDPERVVLAWEGDDGATAELSCAQLDDEARRLAAGLAELGVVTGERVAIYLPALPEAAVALLAAARLGAIAVPLSSGYGADVLASRLADSGAKWVVCADGCLRRGTPVDMLAKARAAAAQCAEVACLVVVPRLGAVAPPEPILASWRERDYRILVAQSRPQAGPAVFDADTPLMLLYTSTANDGPRGVVHTHAGFPLKAAQDMLMTFDVQPGDRLMWLADMGRMLGPWLLFGGLLRGATVVLFEGVPDFPSARRIWQLAARHRVTHLGMSPGAGRLLMAAGVDGLPAPGALDRLRLFGSTGQSWTDAAWHWLFHDVGRQRCPIIHYCGGTEIGGAILACFPGLPQKPRGLAGPVPGMIADVVDAGGRSLLSSNAAASAGHPSGGCGRGGVAARAPGAVRGAGELVLRAPWPGMAHGFWQDDERYLKTCRSRSPGLWLPGDWACTDEDGHWFIHGRSDDTLKVAGRRVAPAEYEFALAAHPLVGDAVAIGVPDPREGEAVVCFVALAREPAGCERGGCGPGDAERELIAHLALRLGAALSPVRVHLVAALPATKNDRDRRRLVRAAYLDEALHELARLDCPRTLDAIRACRPAAAEA
ncbi:AMP-binding protein [Aromatoleum sp.]|uniref:AMP-binding protein n=1 Tax=Aromatoleum sp. TaxID=2307007 RepID=UPI002FCC213A